MKEIWKDVPEWESHYQVSNLGHIRTKDRFVNSKNGRKRFVKGILVVLRYDKDGYQVVHLRDASTKRNKLAKVHRLVASAFLPIIDGKKYIDHKNGKRDDNRVSNLRWCTCKENNSFPLARIRNSYAVRKSYIDNSELRKLRAKMFYERSKKRPVSVFKNDEHVGDYKTIKDAATSLGLKSISVSACLNGRIKTINGYTIKDLCTK